MTALYLQVLLLFTSAFLLGAALACGLRKLTGPEALTEDAAPPVRRVDPLPQPAGATRFEGALNGRGTPPPAPPAPVAPPARTAPVPPPPAVSAPTPAATAAVAATVATAAAAAVASPMTRPVTTLAGAADDLKRIRGIDGALEAGLNKLGIRRYAEIAGWRRTDVDRINAAFGFRGRVERENWIEQAQVLASGQQTQFSRRAGTEPAVTPRQNEPSSLDAGPPAAAATVSAIRPVAGPARDALQRISGVNAEIERTLYAQGVTRYSQIAAWSAADVERFDRLLGATGRIQRENWIEQAQLLARGGDTGASRAFDRQPAKESAAAPAAEALLPARLAEAIRSNQAPASPRSDVSNLRSVRSEAFQPKPMDAATVAAAASAAAAGSAKVVRTADMSDLKRIRGIGVLIEKRLNAAGISTYEQIANWTADDIARFNQMLDFKGRIERENWVEQARILAAGGYTEFSHRVDEGKVETSRPKG